MGDSTPSVLVRQPGYLKRHPAQTISKMRYRTRTLLILIAIAACVIAAVQGIRNFDGPFATVRVSQDVAFELTDEAAISLTESALRQIEFDPVRPIPSYGSTNAMYVVGRNAADSDRITIIWEVRGQDYADYTVRLNRDDDGIIATIYKNWLQDPKR